MLHFLRVEGLLGQSGSCRPAAVADFALVRLMTVLSRRERAFELASAWLLAACLIWMDLLVFLINSLAMNNYEHTFGGRPLPWATTICAAPSSPIYWFPLPAVAFALFATFSRRLSPFERLSCMRICLLLGIAATCTVIFATILPAIPYWPGMVRR